MASSIFRSVDTVTEDELLTVNERTEIVRMVLSNTETADTQVLVNLFKNTRQGSKVRIIGYNTPIAGYGFLELSNIYLDAGQFLSITTDGKIDIDINFKSF